VTGQRFGVPLGMSSCSSGLAWRIASVSDLSRISGSSSLPRPNYFEDEDDDDYEDEEDRIETSTLRTGPRG
jgi:hypothetical protein